MVTSVIPDKKMSPEEELKFLCDLSVKECVAHVSEFVPGAEYFVPEDGDTVIKSLVQTPDLTGMILDGFTSVHRPGILQDKLVMYNWSEEQMLEHMEKIPRHEHVHWMFNEIMKIHEEWLKKFREALPKVKIVYSLDCDDFHFACERMLRVIVQSNQVKMAEMKKSLEDKLKDLRQALNGFDKLKKIDLQNELHTLENKRQKHVENNEKKRVVSTTEKIKEIEESIRLLDKRNELETKLKIFRDAKDEKRVKEAETELVAVKSAIDMKEKGLLNALVSMIAERELLHGKKDKQSERDALDKEISKCKAKVLHIEKQTDNTLSRLGKYEELSKRYGREPETSPIYQRRVTEHVRKMYERFNKLGEKYDIRIVTKPDILIFGSLVIDYAHNRGRTWAPMPGRAKRLAESHHGLMKVYRENISLTLKEMGAKVRDIDVIMESGDSGAFHARWQRLHLTAEEIRMQHVNTFYTGGSDNVKHVVFLAGMPFEAQDNIAKYLNRGKPGRTRGGKPMGTAAHSVFVRNAGRSVSGITLIRKHNHDLISLEPILYNLYRNKEVLKPFVGVMSQDDSDNHFGSPEMDPLGTLGTLAMNDQLMEKPLELYGKKIYLGAKFNLGDTSEANSRVWPEGHKFRRNVMSAIEDIPKQLVAIDQTSYESVLKAMIDHANDMMGGSQENLKLNQRVVEWFFKKQFLNIYHKSPTRLRDIFAHVTGNHFDGATRDSGIQEHDAFENWLMSKIDDHKDFPSADKKPFPLKIMAGGEPQYFQSDADIYEMIVHLGGYSTARQALVPNFGIGYDGKLCVQKTYTVGLTHEPNSILNKARNAEADVTKGGHTHEELLMADKTGHNKGRFIDQLGCTQRVSSTELVYGGIPRTACVGLKVYSQPGRYFKLAIPMEHMRRIGLASLKKAAEAAVKEKNKTQSKNTKK